MFSAKNIAFVVVILALLAGNVWFYIQNQSLNGEVEALLDALSRPSESERDFEGEITGLTLELREEQSERTRQTERAESLEQSTKMARREIAELKIKLKGLEAEVRRSQHAAEAVASNDTVDVASQAEEVETEVATVSETMEVEAEVVEAVEAAVESSDTEMAATTESSTASMQDSEEQSDLSDVYHVVARGDLLQDLARNYYGDETQWRRILDANRDIVSDARSLQIGMRLRIPGATQ